jgi:hypothetical protein
LYSSFTNDAGTFDETEHIRSVLRREQLRGRNHINFGVIFNKTATNASNTAHATITVPQRPSSLTTIPSQMASNCVSTKLDQTQTVELNPPPPYQASTVTTIEQTQPPIDDNIPPPPYEIVVTTAHLQPVTSIIGRESSPCSDDTSSTGSQDQHVRLD